MNTSQIICNHAFPTEANITFIYDAIDSVIGINYLSSSFYFLVCCISMETIILSRCFMSRTITYILCTVVKSIEEVSRVGVLYFRFRFYQICRIKMSNIWCYFKSQSKLNIWSNLRSADHNRQKLEILTKN